ncbi:MAG TPA: NAD(P)-dependent oxidoreductase [Propionibacteriaceae bacterium]|nr:NAD(P)-dependent oxidoreductase [Propionibacteriaceae bacterium]
MAATSAGDRVGIGVIGLGMMGRPMAVNLLEHSDGAVHITGRGRDRYADLLDAGAVWHETARSLASEVGILLLMLPDLPQVEEILTGPDGILAAEPADLLLIISSSSSPVGVRELADRLHHTTAGAVRVIDAPVSGGVDGAEAGTLSIMVGGEDRDVAQAQPVLAACGNPVHLGPLGSGQVAKACNQMIVASTILALGEAAVLADRSGIDLAEMFRLLGGGYAGSRILETRGDRIVNEDYSPSGVAKYMVKDLGFATAVAEATDTHVVLLPAIKAAFEELTAQGHGDHDIAVTRRYVSQR